jgi:dephospho-CoA kinase
VQKVRVLARPGMTEAQLSAILAKQLPDAEKRRRADTIIDTGAGFDAARAQVRTLLARLGVRRADA